MYKDYEHWVDIEECENTQISDRGRVRHSRSKRLFKISLNKNSTPIFRTSKNGVFKSFTVAKLVYKYFGDGAFPTDRRAYILRKDGNKFNNSIDNLFLATTKNDKYKQEWQIDVLNQQVLLEIQNIIKYRKPFNEVSRAKSKYTIDKQELEQGSLIEIFKNIGKLVEGEPLYNFCYKYVKYVWYKLIRESNNKLGIYKI